MLSHCLRCREQTTTKNGSMEETANGRTQYKGQCTVCGGKKAQFVSNAQATSGGGIKGKKRGKKGKGFGDSDSVYADIGRFFGI